MGCHGVNGISATKGVPHLAGQRPAYTYLELKAYKSGARGAEAMTNAVKFLSDDALVKVAAYYASLDPRSPHRRAAQRSALPNPTPSKPARPRRRVAPAAMATAVSARRPACRIWPGWIPSTSLRR